MSEKSLKIIITGSEGLLGSEISQYLSQKYQVIRLDLRLGHDLDDENFVSKWFSENNADCLVNCFALNDHVEVGKPRGTLFDISLNSFRKFLDVNLTSLFSVCREFARNNSHGSIVNFSSTSGIVSPRPDLYGGGHKHPGYNISKAGVINLTKYLATHLAPNIRVNCIAPGGVEFDQDQGFKNAYSSLTPMKRMMKKNELNKLVEYMCTSDSSYMTGSTIVVDGGWTIW